MPSQSPMKPPPWTGKSIELDQPPVCIYCIDDRGFDNEYEDHGGNTTSGQLQLEKNESSGRHKNLAQRNSNKEGSHRPSGSDSSSGGSSSTKRGRARFEAAPLHEHPEKKKVKLSRPVSQDLSPTQSSRAVKEAHRPTHVSIFKPLEKLHSYTPQETRPLPKWMSKLPSNRRDALNGGETRLPQTKNASLRTEQPDESSVSLTSLHSLSFHSKVIRDSLTLKHQAKTSGPSRKGTPKPMADIGSCDLSSVSDNHSTSSSSTPKPKFFQSSRTPFISVARTTRSISRRQSVSSGHKDSFYSTEFLDKYNVIAASTPSLPSTQTQCPICEDDIPNIDYDSPPPSIKPSDSTLHIPATNPPTTIIISSSGTIYHTTCLACRSCLQPFDTSQDDISDWTFLGAASPYHKCCVAEGSKPILERLKRRLRSSNGDFTISPSRSRDTSGAGKGHRGDNSYRSTRQLATSWLRGTAGARAGAGTATDVEPKTIEPERLHSMKDIMAEEAGGLPDECRVIMLDGAQEPSPPPSPTPLLLPARSLSPPLLSTLPPPLLSPSSSSSSSSPPPSPQPQLHTQHPLPRTSSSISPPEKPSAPPIASPYLAKCSTSALCTTTITTVSHPTLHPLPNAVHL